MMIVICLKKDIDEPKAGAHGGGAAAFGDDLHDVSSVPDDGAAKVVDRRSFSRETAL